MANGLINGDTRNGVSMNVFALTAAIVFVASVGIIGGSLAKDGGLLIFGFSSVICGQFFTAILRASADATAAKKVEAVKAELKENTQKTDATLESIKQVGSMTHALVNSPSMAEAREHLATAQRLAILSDLPADHERVKAVEKRLREQEAAAADVVKMQTQSEEMMIADPRVVPKKPDTIADRP